MLRTFDRLNFKSAKLSRRKKGEGMTRDEALDRLVKGQESEIQHIKYIIYIDIQFVSALCFFI